MKVCILPFMTLITLIILTATPAHNCQPLHGASDERQGAVQLLPLAEGAVPLHRRRKSRSVVSGVPSLAS